MHNHQPVGSIAQHCRRRKLRPPLGQIDCAARVVRLEAVDGRIWPVAPPTVHPIACGDGVRLVVVLVLPEVGGGGPRERIEGKLLDPVEDSKER